MRDDPTAGTQVAEPKQVLALDGGGVRGAISVAFLERIEAIYREQQRGGDPVVLADQFDLIGGTSTGAIIGTTLALGRAAGDIRDFYFRLAPLVFGASLWRIPYLQSRFTAENLEHEIARVIGERTLESAELRTGLAIVMKRMDTGSAWIVSNSPASKYWGDPTDGSYTGNRHYRLASLVRASTAAPYYFAPEEIEVIEGKTRGVFVDGGVSPYNNPVLAMLQVATLPAHGYCWPVGADKLRIISIGTGSHRPRLDPRAARHMTAAGLAARALLSVVSDCSAAALTVMQMLGSSDDPSTINSELGDLRGALLPPEPLFAFQRYDVELEQAWLRDELGFALTERRVEELREMDRARERAAAL